MIFQQLTVKKLSLAKRKIGEHDVEGRSNYSVPILIRIYLRTTPSAPKKQNK